MKTRRGFVSNSSTSSFVLLMTNKAQIEALSDLEDWERDFVMTMFEKSNEINITKFLGQTGVEISYMGCDFSSRPSSVEEMKGGIEQTDDQAYHGVDCHYEGKDIGSDYCPGCGCRLKITYFTNTPRDAWTSYLCKINALVKDPEWADEVYHNQMSN